SLLFDLEPVREILNINARDLQHKIRHETLFREHFVSVKLQLGLAILRIDGRDGGLLRHRIAFEFDLQVLFVSFRGFDLEISVRRLLFHLRVRHFHDHRRWIDCHTGLEINLLHTAVSGCRHPASYLGDQGAVAAHVANHLAAFDGFDDGGRAIEGWGRRLQLGEAVSNSADACHTNNDHDGITNFLLDLRFRGSLDIHSCYFKNLWRAVLALLRERRCAREVVRNELVKLHAQLYSSPVWYMSKPVPAVDEETVCSGD